MQQIIPLLLSLLQRLAPGATTSVIGEVIAILSALVPVLVQEYKDLLPIVQNIIAALQSNGNISPEQWAALDTMSAQYDAEFMTALAAAKAQDAALKS